MMRNGWREVGAGLVISTLLGVTLGAIGPFGSYLNGALPVRIAYWVACLWIGWLVFGLGVPLLSGWAQRRALPAWLWAPPVIAILAILPAIASRMLALRLWPMVARVGWFEWYGQCLLLSVLLTIGMLLRARAVKRPAAFSTNPETGPDPTSGPASADLRDRLPAYLGRDIKCLQMEDHYVRVHTPHGSALVLMSLSQAMAGLTDIEGVQTHRSWWVAQSAITGVVEDGRKLRLRLTGGLEAPVSRARVGLLREAGWLAPAIV
ncbi:LytTR family DNA-binding domain-containing protein [Sphingomonas sp.]|uniref:LytTR family DNA-binding domain-containing protein n=1 Tax=Sphingomonas sp. TaxID=28214 RepID=UPI003D6D9E8C